MPKAIRNLLVLGIVLTLIGLVGLAAMRASGGLVRVVFLPSYAIGALCLIGAGVWWLVRFTRRRDD